MFSAYQAVHFFYLISKIEKKSTLLLSLIPTIPDLAKKFHLTVINIGTRPLAISTG